ncbi:RNA recognition motif domain-containing protein [Ditylenchus destructor]|nr:RNA recognition motif domain-containing protein [Ditylenchus destructor]
MSNVRNALQRGIRSASILTGASPCLSSPACWRTILIIRQVHDEEKRAKREEKAQNIIRFVQNLQICRTRTIYLLPSAMIEQSPMNDQKFKKTALKSFSQAHLMKSHSKSFPKLELRKYAISVYGLSRRTSNTSLQKFYSQFGDLIRCYILRDDGSSRPRGIVVFSSKEASDRALNSLPHQIDGKKITDVQPKACKNELALRVSYLSPRTSVKSLRSFYARFGPLAHGEIKKDPVTEKSLGFGYVAFISEDSLNRCLDAQPHVIDGKEVMLQYLTGELDLAIDELPEDITEQSLHTFFSQYGHLRDCLLTTNSMGKTVGYVSFSTLEQVERAMDDRPHIIEGKRVTTNYSDKQSTHFSLFVGSLPENVTENSVCEVFSKFGKLVHYNVYYDGQLNQSRPYAFISYANEEEALDALNKGPHMIEGTEVNVRRASEVSSSSYNTRSNPQSVSHQKIERIEERIRPPKMKKIPKQPTARQALDALNKGPHMIEGTEVNVRRASEVSSSSYNTRSNPQSVSHQKIERIEQRIRPLKTKKTPKQAAASQPHTIKSDSKSFPKLELRKYSISILGLSSRTSFLSLHKFYSQFGDIIRCYLLHRDSGGNRGIVVFSSNEARNRALNSLPHRIDDRKITNVIIKARKSELALRVLYLSPRTTEKSLGPFYARFGTLDHCEIKTDPCTRKSLGFGYVAFRSEDSLNRCLDAQPHVIDGKEVMLQYLTGELDLIVEELPEGITEKSLHTFFSQYGLPSECKLTRTSSGKPVAHVSFSTLNEVRRAMDDRPHIFDGKRVVTSYSGKDPSHFSIFVGSLPENVTEDSVCKVFSKFGKLVNYDVFYDGRLNQSRPYAFISYANEEQALDALNKGPHMIEGTEVNVRKASEVSSSSYNTRSNPQNVRHQKIDIYDLVNIPKQPAASQELEAPSKSPHMVRGAAGTFARFVFPILVIRMPMYLLQEKLSSRNRVQDAPG